jgi:recombination protein RecA
MSKQKTESKDKLKETLDALNKKYGIGTISLLGDNSVGEYDVISTGSLAFDYNTLGVGGFVKGKLYELMGWDGCLAEDTYIKFINVRPDGVVQDCKGGTIKNLFDRFHNRTSKTVDTTFNVASINDKDRVFRNEIADVVCSGIKPCYELTTKKGFKIKATKDHKFYTGTNYVALENLSKGSIIFVHTNTPYSVKEATKRRKYKETTVKWYYKKKARLINGVPYYGERVSRLVFEAAMNNLTYEEYKDVLNKKSPMPRNLWTIPEGFEIHHIDENSQNDSIENLQLIDYRDHGRLHAIDRHNNLRFIVTPDEVDSITFLGDMNTYDIKCYFPYNNFIAEGIVVHNSGKSTICGHAAAECQKKGGTVLYIDGEHALDKTYFKALGVDIVNLLISQPSHGEEGFSIAIDMINTGKIDLLIIDSDSSLIPKKVLDGEVGDAAIGRKAMLNSSVYPKMKSALVDNKTCVIVVSQYREKIGVMFGSPLVTQGGHALKFYADCRIEISRSLAKENDTVFGNLTKVKCTKNKMFPPYRMSEFNIIFGKGIDRTAEMINLLSDLEIGRKWGKDFTIDGVKHELKDFEKLISTDMAVYEKYRNQIIDKLKNPEVCLED